MEMISIVIPTCNREGELLNCLIGLKTAAAFLDDGDFEIIVSCDGVISSATTNFSLPISVLQGPGAGPAANRNWGAKHAKGEW